MYLRHKCFNLNITDTMMFWALKRQSLTSAKNIKKIVVIGKSRSQLGIDPAILESEFRNINVTHLAIDGTSSLYVLKDLADDPKFSGIVLFSMTVGDLRQEAILDAKPWVDFYHSKFDSFFCDMSEKINTLIQVRLQSLFVLLSSEFNFKAITYKFLSQKDIKPLYCNMQPNRFRPAYYHDRLSPDELREHIRIRIDIARASASTANIDRESFLQSITTLALYSRKLQEKGGKLIIVRMPSTGEHWAIDEKIFPKKDYWDRISKMTNIPTVHFLDYPSLNRFDCPDTSHIDARDSTEFTRNLSKIIKPYL